MILSFSTHIDNQPTCFIEKIWNGLLDAGIFSQYDWERFFYLYQDKFNKDWDSGINLPKKIHTIREDKNNRWEAGKLIHPIIHNRTLKRFQFTPEFECKSIQDIFITYRTNDLEITIAKVGSYIGGEDFYLYRNQKELLAINDGFSNYSDFVKYFKNKIDENRENTGNAWFKGKIIHWTDFKY